MLYTALRRSIIKQLFSNSSFVDKMDSRDQQQLLPMVPEDVVLTNFMKDDNKDNSSPLTTPNQKEKKSYQTYLKSNPYGSVEKIHHKQHQLTLISTNYHRVSPLSLYQTIWKSIPDTILIQTRPELFKRITKQDDNFIVKNKDGIFSDLKFLQKINLSQNLAHGESFLKQFNYSNAEQVERIREYISATITQRNHSKKLTIPEAISSFNQRQIVSGKALISPFYFYQMKLKAGKNIDIYAIQMPQRIHRQWIVNTNTLMQLQQIFNTVCKNFPRYKSLSLNLYKLATMLFPEIFLATNDIYMATIIQMLIATKKYRNIVGLFGITQNLAVRDCLCDDNNPPIKPVLNYLIPEKPKSNIMRNIKFWQILEKHIILDVMYYGQAILQVPIDKLGTTLKMMQFYGKQYRQKGEQEILARFQLDMIQKYLTIFKDKQTQGQAIIKKQFMREAIRQRTKIDF